MLGRCAYVESTITDATYFASPCKFGPEGVKEASSLHTHTLTCTAWAHACVALFVEDCDDNPPRTFDCSPTLPCGRVERCDLTQVLGYGTLSDYEKGWFDKMLPDLKKQIAKGIEFANK